MSSHAFWFCTCLVLAACAIGMRVNKQKMRVNRDTNATAVNNDTNATALAARDQAPNITKGWNVEADVGSKLSRKKVEDYFGVTTTTDDKLWKENVLTAFVGRSMKIVKVDLIEKNAVNSIIKHTCDTTSVVWKFAEDSMSESMAGVPMTGHGVMAGWINYTANVEHDHKTLFGIANTLDDWGVFSVEDLAETTFTVYVWSMKKGRFRMHMEEVKSP